MRYQIRKNVFETNSSSTHSIVVTKNDIHVDKKEFKSGMERIYLDKNGTWEIWDEESLEFGRYPMNLLVTVADKAKYVFAEYCGPYGPKEKAAEIIDTLKKIIPELKNVSFPTQEYPIFKDENDNIIDPSIIIHSEYKNDTIVHYYIKDGKKIFVKESEYYTKKPYYGYVDHQSIGIVENFLKTNNITLEEFLSNKRYIICIDGDEYCVWDMIKYSGLINIDNIVSEFDGSNENLEYKKDSDI